MSLVGKKAPLFKASAVINGMEIVENFSLEQFIGKSNVLFFFYPKDFTFVCPTELHAFQARLEEFKERGCEVVACSTDTEESHWNWLQLPKEKGGIQGVSYPLVADTAKTISTNFGVLAGEYDYNEEGNLIATGPMIAYRGLFLIDKEGVVQHQVVNNFPLGRSVSEALRILDALTHFEEHGEVCPANWQQGEAAMEASFSGVSEYFSAN
ncbi:peroxiredoxin (alkyl hydroperoxide reductase subunit C) [Anseongella ginsenosidimutans]|uniref:Thioredoxin peroxidase n=1 Tax=Anseongella ginsenosidimutans TaxID=496056 RepID=A0A4R3KWV1_9SPHI|nr:peroxiredoxin [Anseongella ginsenosidimutans]QEC53500.1 peroxiredoxin [Anseongella ginsenosidimutans]TCS88401.1 peroxiredoxin (alkyl hydroperoxide reductase subunit C) [Anseongella ginsenosidimutans]